jgi:hypothetical protein
MGTVIAGPGQRRFLILILLLLVGGYYRWGARVATGKYEFGYDLDGFYNYLGRAFLHGHLYLPVEPSPQLLALANPYDPTVDNSIRNQDMVLYRGKYYLYFGATPAVLLFAPWRLVTGHDLPQNFAAFLLCFGGFLFATGALLRVFHLVAVRPPLWLLAFLILGLAFCQSTPFLLNRVAVYEIAIAGGCFCLSAAVFFLARGLPLQGNSWRWMAAAGLAFGAAVGCRPHLILAGAVALVALAVLHRGRALAAFAAAWMLVGALIGLYNYQRFGNPVEFGFRYQLAGPGQNRIELSTRNWLPGMYYTLLDRPEFSPVFPWMRMVFRFPFNSAERYPLPPEYFVEPSVGALWLAPFVIAALWVPSKRRLLRAAKDARTAEARTVLWICGGGAAAILLFLMSTHLSSQRYEVDFLPLAVFGALAGLGIRAASAPRFWAGAALACAIAYSALANLALGVAGPYDDILRYRPAAYVKLARRFSPNPEYRPLLDPRLAVEMEAQFIPESAGFREPLVTIGRSHYGAFLYAEHASGAIKLVAQTEDGRAVAEFPFPNGTPLRIGLAYAPEAHRIAATVNGREVVSVPAGLMVTAPAQVEFGQNHSDVGLTYPTFTGKISTIQRSLW